MVPIDSPEIVITAARTAEPADETPASVTIVDEKRLDRLGEPLVPTLLRLTPSAAVATSGPAGSFTEVRIRGAEANHTLLFVDGIRANDPAAGNAPRFELLNADLASRVEVVRGPQSALWGSEAIGGVVAVDGGGANGLDAAFETGSFGFARGSLAAAAAPGNAEVGAAIGWQRASGIDSFDGNGDRDGYRNLSGRLRGAWQASPLVEVGASAIALLGRSEFDGFDPVTFAHADTLDSSRNRLAAGRIWTRFGTDRTPLRGELSASLLGSSNRNLLDGEEINRTHGRRANVAAQVERSFTIGGIAHRLIGAVEHEKENFRARDIIYGGLSTQDQDRKHQALTVEWRAHAGPLVGDVALRRDRFNRFKDATSLRASVLGAIGKGLSIVASYGEGIAQPTFFDLYGFFPGSFAGNPSLRPESSRGVEAALRFHRARFGAALTAYRQRLRNEIVDVSDPVTFLSSTANRDDRSRRRGVEAEFGFRLGERLRLTGHYAFLDASEPGNADGRQVREIRRPRHSGSVVLDGESGNWRYGASLAYSGARNDSDFGVFPARTVRLGAYWLGGARVAYRLGSTIELFARAANAFDQSYQDVLGYRTEGRSLHAGIRLASRP